MTVVVFLALIWKVIDFLRLLTNASAQKSAIVTQVSAWAGGIVLVALAAHAQVTAGLVMPGTALPLNVLDWPSVVLVGLLVSSTASATVDIKQAIDSTDSASKPALLSPPPT